MRSERETSRIKKSLLNRLHELRLDIQRELRKYDDETYGKLADRIADSGEQSFADLLTDVNLAEIDRDVMEVRDIESALLRLAQGAYGVCVSCEEPIQPHRLERNPAVARCVKCQQAFENRKQEIHYRTL
jgi:RNA polymerase-binding transcription factor DksA